MDDYHEYSSTGTVGYTRFFEKLDVPLEWNENSSNRIFSREEASIEGLIFLARAGRFNV